MMNEISNTIIFQLHEYKHPSLLQEFISGMVGHVHILLAHGAGAGQGHPDMIRWKNALEVIGEVHCFEYDYMSTRGRGPPDPLTKLISRHSTAVDELQLSEEDSLFLVLSYLHFLIIVLLV
jgi:predicted alpha/beta-hydrolase family hydrolase